MDIDRARAHRACITAIAGGAERATTFAADRVAHLDAGRQRRTTVQRRDRSAQAGNLAGLGDIDEDRVRATRLTRGIGALHEQQMLAAGQAVGRDVGLDILHLAVECTITGGKRGDRQCAFPGQAIQISSRGDDVLVGFGTIDVVELRVIDARAQAHRRPGRDKIRRRTDGGHIGAARQAIRCMQVARRIAQGSQVVRDGLAGQHRTRFKECLVELEGVGRGTKQAVHRIVRGAVGRIERIGLFRRVLVEPGHASAEGAQGRPVRCRVRRVAPRPQDQLRIAVQVEEHAGIVIGCGRAAIASDRRRVHRPGTSIGQHAAAADTIIAADAGNVAHQIIGFRLGHARRSTIGLVADRSAGAAVAGHDAPMEREIAIQIDTRGIAATCRDRVGVLAPGQPGFSFLAAIRIGLQDQVEVLVIDQPGGFGIATVVVEQPFGEVCGDFGRGVFARMDRIGDDHVRLVGDRRVGGRVADAQDAHRITLAGVLRALPGRADIDHPRQRRMGGGEVVHRLVGFFDRAIAGIGRNAAARIAECLSVELAHVRGGRHVDAVLDAQL